MLVLVPFVVGLGWLAYRYLTFDEAPPEDGDLQLAPVDVPDAENGWVMLGGIALYEPDADVEVGEGIVDWEELGTGTAWDSGLAKEILEKNTGALAHLDRALELAAFRIPARKGLKDDTVTPLLNFRSLCRIALVRCWASLHSGDSTGALRGAVEIVRLGERLQSAGGELIVLLVGVAGKGMGADAVIRMAEKDRFHPADVKAWSRALLELRTSRASLVNCLRAEYRYVSLAAEAVAKGDESLSAVGSIGGSGPWWTTSGIFVRPNQTRRLHAEAYRALIASLSRPGPFQMPAGLGDTAGKEAFWGIPSPNAAGKRDFRMSVPVLERGILQFQVGDAHLTFAATLLALRAWKDARGDLPDSLEALVPDFLDAVPEDPYDGKPLRYSKERRILHSVGEDLQDGGGSAETDPDEARDDRNEPTLRIRF